MPAPVSLVTIHHEGGGKPRNGLAGPLTKGYTVGLGLPDIEWARTPWTSFATFHYNHESLDVLLSGDRDVYPVTASDIANLERIASTARAAKYLVDAPFVRPHRESPGSDTVCPGNNTAYADPAAGFPAGNDLVWLAIVTAFHKEAPPVPTTKLPEFTPAVNGLVSWTIFNHPTLGRCWAGLNITGHVLCEPSEAYLGSPYDDHTGQPRSYWAVPGGTRMGQSIIPNHNGKPGYIIRSTLVGDGEFGPYTSKPK